MSSTLTKVSDIIEQLGCLLADADAVLERLERRFRVSDVVKLLEFVHAISSAAGFLQSVDPASQVNDLPLVDDQSSGEGLESDSPQEEEDSEEC